jgi:hypothetical protein
LQKVFKKTKWEKKILGAGQLQSTFSFAQVATVTYCCGNNDHVTTSGLITESRERNIRMSLGYWAALLPRAWMA